jgi:hypothetical protein
MLYAATLESLVFEASQDFRGNSPHALLLQDPDQEQAQAALQSIKDAAAVDHRRMVMAFGHGRKERELQYLQTTGGGQVSLDGHVEAGEASHPRMMSAHHQALSTMPTSSAPHCCLL